MSLSKESLAKTLAVGLRFFLALLFLATALGKLLDNRGFAQVIASYQLAIPALGLLPIALAVSLAELWIAINLCLGRYITASVLGTLYFHLGYAGLSAITLWRGIALNNCGCFGVFWGRPLRVTSVLEDLCLALVSLLAWQLLKVKARTTIKY
ncbi:MAG: MauE/DoxX family redox-associated membrane protein [Methylococcaceae bacterium]|jgi:hypothetical protein